MLKQKNVSTTNLGDLTVTCLTLSDLRSLDEFFQPGDNKTNGEIFNKNLPAILASLRKVHQDITLDQLEKNLTLVDFNSLCLAVLEVSGMRAVPAGEAATVPA